MTGKTEAELKKETEKWLKAAVEKRKKLKLVDLSKGIMVKNIDAYISDASHFIEREDLVRAFEAVIWAWAWIEILEQLDVIKTEK